MLLREGTDNSQGIPQLISNINACQGLVDVVKTTLGPRGLDKLITTADGRTTISNDGATIMRLLDIVHPAAKTLVDIARSQDSEVGDGTTSVVVFAGAFLGASKEFIEEGVHPQIIVRAYRQALALCMDKIGELAVSIKGKDEAERRLLLERCAQTSLNSKLIAGKKDFFGKMVVDAVLHLDDDMSMDMIGIKKVPGGSVEESFLVHGVAFKKTFAYAGFEQQPKHFKEPRILLLNVELELKAEKENAEIRLEDAKEYQKIVDAEWQIIYDKLDNIVKSGATIVLSKLPIGDLATQYFADRDIFCAGRVEDADLNRVARATGATVQTTVNGITPNVLGKSGRMDEKRIGNERYNIFTDCPDAKTVTIVLRGGAEQFIEETHRSIHDAIMIVRRAVKNNFVVGGGGAIEMELSKHLRDTAKTIHGKAQLLIHAYAKALEIIPKQLCDNAGFDSTDTLNKLRQKHAQGNYIMIPPNTHA